jgi:tRNA(Ile)-lysidine synthase
VTDFQPVAQARQAVRQLLKKAAPVDDVAVAVSGGADSLALAAATAYVAARLELSVHALIVDHQLQPGSADVAATAAKQLHGLGIADVRILTVTVTGRGGPEAAARNARYKALRSAGFPLVLLGHTQDDQAETVLLGLGRGSGPRSIAGMRDLDPPWARPFLSVPRVTTVAACEALGLTAWEDPHNVDPAYTRVRLRREVLPLLEDVLQGGVAPALARTAAQLRDDTEALDALATRLLKAATVEAGLSMERPGSPGPDGLKRTATKPGGAGHNAAEPDEAKRAAAGLDAAGRPDGEQGASGTVSHSELAEHAVAVPDAVGHNAAEPGAAEHSAPKPNAAELPVSDHAASRTQPRPANPTAMLAVELDVAILSTEPPALRRRALRRWLLDAGVPELSDAHLRSADALISDWRGQGDTWLPGNFAVGRTRGRLRVSGWARGEGTGCTATTSPPC